MGKKQKYCQIVNSLQFFCPLEWKLLSLSALKKGNAYIQSIMKDEKKKKNQTALK